MSASNERGDDVDGGDEAGQARGVHSPPDPGFIAVLVALARKFKLVAIAGDAGVFEGHTVAVASDGAHGVRWVAVQGDRPPAGLAPRVIHIRAFEAMLQGELLQDETLLFEGKRYTVVDLYESGRMVAKLSELGTLT